MEQLTVDRLVQNPLGSPAPPGHPGDMVRVSDGRRSIYLLPREYDESTTAHLRWLLAARR